jgi:hypothetical protein
VLATATAGQQLFLLAGRLAAAAATFGGLVGCLMMMERINLGRDQNCHRRSSRLRGSDDAHDGGRHWRRVSSRWQRYKVCRRHFGRAALLKKIMVIQFLKI